MAKWRLILICTFHVQLADTNCVWTSRNVKGDVYIRLSVNSFCPDKHSLWHAISRIPKLMSYANFKQKIQLSNQTNLTPSPLRHKMTGWQLSLLSRAYNWSHQYIRAPAYLSISVYWVLRLLMRKGCRNFSYWTALSRGKPAEWKDIRQSTIGQSSTSACSIICR